MGRRGRRVHHDGSWWSWYPTGWIELSPAVAPCEWEGPLDLRSSPELAAYAREVLAETAGYQVSERAPDGYVYLFTHDRSPAGYSVFRCWPNQGGTMGSSPGPLPPQLAGTVGNGPAPSTATPQLTPATANVVERPHPRGMVGVRAGMREICRRIVKGARSRRVIEWSRRVIAEANIDMPRGYPVPDKVVRALFEAGKKQVAFIKDPVNTELMIDAEQLLCLTPDECYPAGDCDDQLIWLGAALMSVGIPVYVRAKRYKGATQAHVDLLYDSGARLGGPLKGIDPSIEDGAPSTAPFLEEIIEEPNSGEDSTEGVFVGIGEPGTVGDAPMPQADAATSLRVTLALDHEAELLASWVARLQRCHAHHARSRAARGLPEFDIAAGCCTALPHYLGQRAWTAGAAAAQDKVIATAAALVQAARDALAGARPLVALGNGDVGIAARAGDAFGVLATPDRNGQLQAWYVDAASAGFVASIWSMAVVRRLVEALTNAHAADAEVLVAGDVGAGWVTPGDVLAYRALWNDYVLGMARAAQTCAGAWSDVAGGTTNTLANQALLSSALTPAQRAQIEQGYSDDIIAQWNAHQNTPAETLVLEASSILEDFQRAALKVGQFWAPLIAGDCPTVQLPTAPDGQDQYNLLAHLQGLGILTHGLGQIFAVGASGALEAISDVARWGKNKVDQVVDRATSPLVWVVIGVVSVAALFYMLPRAPLAAPPATPRTSGERLRRLPARRRRRRPRLRLVDSDQMV